jgi:ABC-2 type transport system ATP-binding protein
MDKLLIKDLTKKYEEGKYALHKLSLEIPSDRGIFALIGRNGAGKTTLIRILATQLIPTSGKASISGIDVVNEPEALREIIACVPQEARAINWLTPRQFVFSYLLWRGYGWKDARKKAEESMKKLGIEKYIDMPSRKLSGGTKRKVLVATVIASEASVIFLDEPTTGLDPLSRSDLWNTLHNLKKDHFIFLTTHYLEEAEKLADRIGILEDGRLLAVGTLEELRGMVRYPYSIKIFSDYMPSRRISGQVVEGVDGYRQIATTEKEARELSSELIRKGIKFSMNPISLEDIFYFIVKKPIESENYDDEKEPY